MKAFDLSQVGLVLAGILLSGCATSVSVDYPNNWITRDGRAIANPQAYDECLRGARHMVTESQSSVGAGAYGRGTGSLYGSSESTQTMRTDVPLLTSCMASKGYRLRRGSGEMGRLPYESSAQFPLVKRDGWAFEARENQGAEPVWVGGWTTGACEAFRARLDGSPNRPQTASLTRCRRLTLTTEATGTEAWAAILDEGFVAARAPAACDLAITSVLKSQNRVPPSCTRVWLTIP